MLEEIRNIKRNTEAKNDAKIGGLNMEIIRSKGKRRNNGGNYTSV